MANDAEIVIGIRPDGNGARIIKRDLDELARSGDKATNSTERLQKETAKLSGAANVLKGALAGAIGALGIREIVRAADEMTNLQARLKQATRSTQEFETAFKGLVRSSKETGVALGAAVDVFQRLSFSRDEIKATVEEMVQFTSTVQKLGVVSGASTEGLKAGLLQLGQGLSAGVLRAEEFNSILENIPVVGKAIADQFGVTTGELRKLVLEGEVLSEDVFAAIINETERADEALSKMPLTAGRAFGQLKTDLLIATGLLNETTNATSQLAYAISDIGKVATALANTFSGLFDFLKGGIAVVAGVVTATLEAPLRLMNLIIEGINRISGKNIGQLDIADTLGDIRKGSFQAFGDEFASGSKKLKQAGGNIGGLFVSEESEKIETSTRNISKNYAEIVKGISGSTKESKKLETIQKQLNNVVKDTLTPQEKFNATVKELERLRGFAKTEKEITAIGRALKNAREELDQVRIDAELDSPLGEAFKSLSSEIEDDFKEAFREGFNDADGGFEKLISGWKETFKTFLADLAYTALARPIVLQLAGGIGGAFGLSQDAIAQTLGTSGGSIGGGTSGLGSLGSIGSSLLNGGLYSSSLGTIGAKLSANLFAGGDLLSSAAFNGAQAFGNLGYGAIGGGLANILGLGSDNSIVNFASGGLGSLAGGAIGSSIGTIAGFAGGPVGAIVGSFLGTALGGLFGGSKPSDKAQSASVFFDTGKLIEGGQSGNKFSQENRDFAKAVRDEAANLTSLLKSAGADIGGAIKIVAGNRDGLRLVTTQANGNITNQNFGNNTDALIDAVANSVIENITSAPEDLKKVLQNVDGYDTKQVAEAIGLLELSRSFEKAGEASKPLTTALDGLESQFDTLKNKMLALGLPVDALTESYENQRQAIIDTTLKPLQDFLDSQAISSNSSLSTLDKLNLTRSSFDENLSAIKLGDLSGLGNITTQANALLNIGRDVFASGEGFASLESFVRQSITGIAGDLGAPGALNDSVTREISLSNAQQTSLLAQMDARIESLVEENRKLRKSMERVGNQLVVMTA